MEAVLNNGNKIPLVGLGTYLIKDSEVCKRIVKEAIKVGYKLIDTASAYKNEEFIGEVLQDLPSLGVKREDLFVTTKLAPADQGKGVCKQKVLESIERLKTPYVDLVLIHWPGMTGLDPADDRHSELRKGSWEDLEELAREGRVKSIGVSNYMIPHLQELFDHCSIRPTVNQVEFHPLLVQQELVEFCNKNAVFFQAYSSLGSAKGWDMLSGNESLNDIAKRNNKSVAQVLLKWALQHGVGVIPKTSRVENLKPNFELFDFEISAEEMKKIDSLNCDTRFCWDPNKIK